MIGETIGNFKVTQRLGQGGMGEVYLAEQTTIGTKAAIKVMRPDVSSDEEYVQRFFNEARAVSRIQHAGIVRIFDVGYAANGEAYLIMEFLEGETLQQRITTAGKLPLLELCDFGKQIASVLGATHGAGITHRDLKPDNIFIIPDKELARGERIKVLDFGIAKLTGTLASSSPATMGTMGTPAYMAPEQWGDSAKVDWRADVYSLGCVAFEMACGRPPFVVRTIAEACAMHLHEPAPSAQQLVPELPVALDNLLARLLAKSPADRPESMQEIAHLFEAIGDGRASAVLAIAAATTAAATAVSRVHPTQLEPPPPAKKSRATLIALGGLAIAGVAAAGTYFVATRDEPARLASAPPPPQAAAVLPPAPGDASNTAAVATDSETAHPPVAPAVAPAATIDAGGDVVAVAPDAASGTPKHEQVTSHPPAHGPTIDRKKVDEILRAHDADYAKCYARAVAKAPEQDAKLAVKFNVEPDGFATQVSVKGFDGGADRCVTSIIEPLKFPNPSGGKIVVDETLEIDKAAATAAAAAATVAAAATNKSLPVTLKRFQLMPELSKVRTAVVGCGTKLNASGRVTAHITIAPDGSVTAATTSDAPSSAVNDCVVAEIKRVKFPASQSGAELTRVFDLTSASARGRQNPVEPE